LTFQRLEGVSWCGEVQIMQMKLFAQQTNLPPKTIRCYEEIGLLPPPQRLANGYRVYDEGNLARAKLVVGTRRLDFSLDNIQEILRGYSHRGK
jgi:MerR family transcriptional regulator, copper efflux regulator